MAAKNTIKGSEKQSEKLPRFSFFSDMSPERKSNLLKCAGVAVFVFVVFTFVSIVSYLFTWKADQSLLSQSDMLSKSVEVANWGGKLGYKWSRFLVSDFLGLGSFAFVFLLGAVAYRLFFWRRSIGLAKTALVTVSGAFLAALILSLPGSGSAFGGGLGGDAGYAAVSGMDNLFGRVVTCCILLALIVVWLLFVSGRFSVWFAGTGERNEKSPESEKESDAESGQSDADAPGPDNTGNDSAAGEEDAIPFPDGGLDEDYEESEASLAGCGCTNGGDEYLPAAEPYCPACDDGQDSAMVEDSAVSPQPDASSGDGADEPGCDMEVVRNYDFTQKVTAELPRIDNREELQKYNFPSLDLLEDYAEGQHQVSQQELDTNNNMIRATLQNYRVEVNRVTAVVGPTVTLYKVVPAPGVKVSSIENLHREIAMALNAKGVRIVTLPDCVGIEVANSTPSIVPLKAMFNDVSFRESKAELPVAVGYTITKRVKIFDLADAPHLLIAGATKQGKSVGLNVIVSSLLYAKHPSELKFVFIDPKMVEFTAYESLIKHYLAVLPLAASEQDERSNAIVKDPKQAEAVLNSLCIEMDERYKLLSLSGENNLKLYNEKYKDRRLLPTDGHKYLPYLVVVIDEYADLTMAGGTGPEARKSAKSIESSIVRLAQKGRAAGIHVIIATQRPSVNVITGLIKTNFPTRIAFRVVSRIDSSTILDTSGAENLIGRGDMLYYAGVEMERVQCALVSMAEINRITSFIGSQTGYRQCYNTPYYLPVPVSQDGESGGGMIDMQNIDPLFEDAARLVVQTQKGSTSDLQRKMGMGYARAGRVMDQLEAAGIVGPQEGSKPRQVLVADLIELEEVIAPFMQQ